MMATAEYMREWRLTHPGYATKYQKHTPEAKARALAATKAWRQRTGANKAHCAVARAIKRGDLVRPSVCSRCQQPGRIEASHDDYSKPLEVEWLCRRCHADKDQRVR